MYYSEKK